MSQIPATLELDEVRREERKSIEERRQAAGLSAAERLLKTPGDPVARPHSEGKLVGLCLSGGGLRSACFGTGFVQALHRTGLWRFVDYLSTVSGGGYIGGHLTSTSLRDQQPFTEQNFPLCEEPGHKQPPSIQRLIYSGHYLLKPWLLFNKWLIGVVLVNLAIFSAMLTVCALTALAWRALDFPWVRDRAELLGWGDDLMAPFWPALFLFGIWLIAWLLSFYRRGSEATGRYARFFLYLAVPSLLIGGALLVGNGDIAGGAWMEHLFGAQTISIRPEIWGPVVVLILVGLLPLLQPRRLLQSGVRPQKKWERAVFLTASTALLVGLPLCLIGLLARENISGYNTFPYRDLIFRDIQSWPSLLAFVMPHQDDEVRGEQQEKADAIRQSLARMRGVEANDENASSDETRLNAMSLLRKIPRDLCRDAGSGASQRNQAYLHAVAALILAGPDSLASGNQSLLPGGPLEKTELAKYLVAVRDFWGREEVARSPNSRLQRLLGPEAEDGTAPAWERLAAVHPWEFLYLRSWELMHVMDACERRRRALMEDPSYYRRPWQQAAWQPLSGYLRRIYHVLGWMGGDTNRVSAYWDAKERQETLQTQIAYVLNQHVLADRDLLDRQLEILTEEVGGTRKSPSNAVGGTNVETRLWETLHASKAAYDPAFPRLVSQARRVGALHVPQEDLPRLNRLLLEHSLFHVFRPRSEIRRLVSIYEDQWTRLKWVLVSLGAFLVCSRLNLNALSMHGYYRDRLVQAFLVQKPGKSLAMPLSQIDATHYGSPYHLISTTVSAPGSRSVQAEHEASALEQASANQDDRWLDSFLMSSRYCGSRLTGYVATAEYERRIRGDLNRLTLAEAIALSGAAISPGHSSNRLVTFLMMVLNLRLGQWLPNPLAAPTATRPNLLTLLASMFRHPRKRPYFFVTDGGISENLGLVQLLSRRCRLVFAVDAGHDPRHDFVDLAKAVRTARIHGGVQLVKLDGNSFENEIQPGDLSLPLACPEIDDGNWRDLQANRCCHTQDHVLLARILYPDAEEGLLVYIKPSLTGDEPLDLLEYRRLNHEFPHEPTTDQVYEPEQVESYRRLGYHIGMRVAQLFAPLRQGETLWHEDWTADDLCREILGATRPAAPPDAADEPLQPAQDDAAAVSPPQAVAVPAAVPSDEGERPDFGEPDRLLNLLREHLPDLSAFEPGQLHDVLVRDRRLAEWTDSDVIQSLWTVLRDGTRAATDREFAVRWLLQMEATGSPAAERPQTVEVLSESLRSDADESVRAACADALAVLGQSAPYWQSARGAVLEALNSDPSPQVRWRARTALHHLENVPPPGRT